MPRGRVPTKGEEEPKKARKAQIGRPSPVLAAVEAPEEIADERSALEDVTTRSLATLRLLEKSINDRIVAGEVTAAVQREASSLSRAIVALGAEARQQAKFYANAAEKLDDDAVEKLVLDWLTETSPARQARVLSALAEMQSENSLLS